MRNYGIILRPRAKIDLDEIWFSIAHSDISSADGFLAKLHDKLMRLANFPESGALRQIFSPECAYLSKAIIW